MGRHFWFYRQLLVLLYWRTSAGSDDPVAPITTVEDKVFIGPSRTGWRRMATRFTSDVHLRDWRSLDEGFEHGAEPLARWIASPVLAVGFRRRGAHKRERERERKKKETETGRRRWPPSSAPDELLSFWLNAEIASQYPAPPPTEPTHLSTYSADSFAFSGEQQNEWRQGGGGGDGRLALDRLLMKQPAICKVRRRPPPGLYLSAHFAESLKHETIPRFIVAKRLRSTFFQFCKRDSTAITDFLRR